MVKKLLIIILLIWNFNFSSYGQQIVCTDFTITGTVLSNYGISLDPGCTVSPLPIGQVLWTQTQINGWPMGFLKHTFNAPQTNVSIWYLFVNDNDIGTISVNGGGVISLSVAGGCANVSGNIMGPYTGSGNYGDVLVNVQSTLPFTEVTLLNTGGMSGHGAGDCNSVIINNPNSCNIQLGNDTILCQGETMILDATTTNATYLWQDNSTNSTLNVTQQGTYWVDVTVNGCTARDSVDVTINQLPIINLGTDIDTCVGNTITLDATTIGGTYTWQDGSSAPTFISASTGTYWVDVTINGCTTRDSIDVTINALPNVIANATSIEICSGSSVALTGIGANSYSWSNSVIDGVSFSPSSSSIYTVTGTDINNCENTDQITVIVNPLPLISLGSDTSICDETLLLSLASTFSTYLWQDGSFDPTLKVSFPGFYNVTVSDGFGCTGFDEVEVYEECPFSILIPNVFTPNGDGENDVFIVSGTNLETVEGEIFNRWGQKIFSWANIKGYWNGRTSAGEIVSEGTYFYIIEYSFYKGQTLINKIKKGTITLLK